jgi:transcriptional regulator with XRE-family HTH domain
LLMDLKQGGQFLRARRKALDLTIEDVTKDITARTGVKMETSDISRLENGRTTSPSLEKAVAYGIYLGITPNEVARAYGLWTVPKRERLTQIAQQMEQMPEEEAEQLLETLATLVRNAVYGRAQSNRPGHLDA